MLFSVLKFYITLFNKVIKAQFKTEMVEFIIPNWQAPPQVRAYTTTRQGGCSQFPYASFNLADHVGDDSNAVATNRATLKQLLQLPTEPLWLTQVHGIEAVIAEENGYHCAADASYTHQPHRICVILTADCLPILFCDRKGTQVAAAHAGWRGLAGGILEATVQRFDAKPQDILAWLGPAISAQAFEVGDEVRESFLNHSLQAEPAFHFHRPGHWLADLYLLAKQRLNACGIKEISGGDFCTYTDATRFYSYRRDKITGRMASLIWLTGET